MRLGGREGNHGPALRIVAVLPVDELREYTQVGLPALAASRDECAKVRFFDERLPTVQLRPGFPRCIGRHGPAFVAAMLVIGASASRAIGREPDTLGDG